MKSGFEIDADDSGRVDLSGKPAIAAIAPLMPVYGPTGEIFHLAPDRGIACCSGSTPTTSARRVSTISRWQSAATA